MPSSYAFLYTPIDANARNGGDVSSGIRGGTNMMQSMEWQSHPTTVWYDGMIGAQWLLGCYSFGGPNQISVRVANPKLLQVPWPRFQRANDLCPRSGRLSVDLLNSLNE